MQYSIVNLSEVQQNLDFLLIFVGYLTPQEQ